MIKGKTQTLHYQQIRSHIVVAPFTRYKNLLNSRTIWSSLLQYLLVLIPFTLDYFGISIDNHEGLASLIGLVNFLATSYFRMDTKTIAYTNKGLPGRDKPTLER